MNILVRFWFFAILIFLHSNASSQNVEAYCRKAYFSEDSSGYYFNLAKTHIKNKSDQANWYFTKQFRATTRGENDSALGYARLAENLYIQLNDTNRLLIVYNNMGTVYRRIGQYEQAIKMLFLGLKQAEIKNDEAWIGYFTTNIGLNYHDFSDYAKGVEYGKMGYRAQVKATKNGNAFPIALALNCIAINFDDWQKTDSALFYHFKVFDYIQRLDTLQIGFTYNNIGNSLLKKKQFTLAKNWIERALKIAQLWAEKNKQSMDPYETATNYMNLATIESEWSHFEKADQLYHTAYPYVEACGNIEKLREYYLGQYLLNKKMKRFEKALEFQDLYYQIKDSIFQTERTEIITELETKYQTKKKENELIQSKNQALKVENERKQTQMWLIFSMLFTVFIASIATLIYRQQRFKNRQQKADFELREALLQKEAHNRLQEQRLSISHDLHDNLGAQLTFISSAVKNLQFKASKEDSTMGESLDKIQRIASKTVVELRDTLWAVHSQHLTLEDLRARLLNTIEQAHVSHPEVSVQFESNLNSFQTSISSWFGIHLLRTIQEFVNNSLKYSQANLISIGLYYYAPNIELKLSDNGIGFEMDRIKKGNGLNNMASRIAKIGGKYQLNSQPNQGTSLLVKVPIS